MFDSMFNAHRSLYKLISRRVKLLKLISVELWGHDWFETFDTEEGFTKKVIVVYVQNSDCSHITTFEIPKYWFEVSENEFLNLANAFYLDHLKQKKELEDQKLFQQEQKERQQLQEFLKKYPDMKAPS